MATANINPSADAHFDEQDTGQNYNESLLKVQQRDFDSILKFSLSSLPEFSIISAATLYLYCSTQIGSTVGNVCETTDGWTETEVNWGNAPTKGTSKGNLTSGTGWKTLSVTSYIQAQWAGDKIVSFRIGPTAGNTWDGQYYHSRENTNKPYLYITYTVLTPPAAPSNCTSHYVATDNAKCTWSDNSNNETGFRIEKAIDGAGFSFWKNVGAGVQDSGTYTLGTNHRIAFRVRAYNDAGDSDWSTSGYTYTTPGAPSGCTISLGTIDIIWTDNSAYEEGFQIDRQLNSGGWSLIHTTAAEAESWADSSQPTGANSKYEYRVRAKKGSLYSGYSTANILFILTCSESITLDDDYSRVWSIVRAYTEDITLSDIYSRVCNWFRTFTENISIVDTLLKSRTLNKFFTESLVLADILQKKTTRVFSESITLTDIYSRIWNIYRLFPETLNLTDFFKKGISKAFTEALHLQDSYIRVVAWSKIFVEEIGLTDTVLKVKRNILLLWKKLINLFDIEGY